MKEEWLQWHTSNKESHAQVFKFIAKKSMARLISWSKKEFRGRDKKVKELMRKPKSIMISITEAMKSEALKSISEEL